MGVETNSIFQVEPMEDLEAQALFLQIVDLSDDVRSDLIEEGEKIVSRCGGLPIAIKTIASNLKCNKDVAVWRHALECLKCHEPDSEGLVLENFKMSYNRLNKEAQVIFQLCGLFPDDFNIVIEDLTRYRWGLGRFNQDGYTVANARDGTITYVQELVIANLLLESDHAGCVKMHDLVRDFVLTVVSKEEPSKMISSACVGMTELPEDYDYPNTTTLRLMDGDRRLRIPEDVYQKMNGLQVIAFQKMEYPWLHGLNHCSTNLRSLCLSECSLLEDLSPIWNLVNLEILSFANCKFRKLPCAIGKLEKLKLLDLTGCDDLHVDDLAFKSLAQLKELYMQSVKVTEANCNELGELSQKLYASEVEFHDDGDSPPQNMFLKNLTRFRISLGCGLGTYEGKDRYSSKTTLKLATYKTVPLKSKINELIVVTEVLHLEVAGMNYLEECLMPQQLFCKLRVLNVSKCESLRYLFSLSIAEGLNMLEHLSLCFGMEEVVHIEKSEAGVIKFPKLKFLSFDRLPKLVRFCTTPTVIKLPELVKLRLCGLPNFSSIYSMKRSETCPESSHRPAIQSFFHDEVATPMLEALEIDRMEMLKDIWPYQFTSNDYANVCKLREMKVTGCDNVENLFPSNWMPWLHGLEELLVSDCGSIQVIFDLHLERIDHNIIPEGGNRSSLRKIKLWSLDKLREVWSVKHVVRNSHDTIRTFQALRSISINDCESFRYVFTPGGVSFDLGAFENFYINGSKHLGEDTRTSIEGMPDQHQVYPASK